MRGTQQVAVADADPAEPGTPRLGEGLLGMWREVNGRSAAANDGANASSANGVCGLIDAMKRAIAPTSAGVT